MKTSPVQSRKHRVKGKLIVPCKNIKGVNTRQEKLLFHLKDNVVTSMNIYIN